jgi:hypothetical protein
MTGSSGSWRRTFEYGSCSSLWIGTTCRSSECCGAPFSRAPKSTTCFLWLAVWKTKSLRDIVEVAVPETVDVF